MIFEFGYDPTTWILVEMDGRRTDRSHRTDHRTVGLNGEMILFVESVSFRFALQPEAIVTQVLMGVGRLVQLFLALALRVQSQRVFWPVLLRC